MNLQLSNGLAVLPEGDSFTVKKADIFISGGVIMGIGDAPEGFCAGKIIDCSEKLILPGLINCHTHAYMSLFRSHADDRSFEDWLFGHIMPMEEKLSGEDAYWGTLLSCIEMLKTGTTAYLDMHMFRRFAAKAASDIGIRCVLSRGLVGNSRDDKGGISRLNEAYSDMEEFKENSRITSMLGPHAPYTCEPDYLEFTASQAKEKKLAVHIHLSETQNEVNDCIKKHGCTPIALMERCGIFENKCIAAHCVHITDEDIEILKKYNVSVATNPVSNLKLANGIAPVGKMLKAGINVCLGTDSSASNNNLNMLAELNTLALIHKGVSGDPKSLPAGECFKIATLNGARALGINSGEIRVGANADLGIMSLRRPWLVPRNDLIAALAYSASGTEFETVITDGEILMENGVITKIDENEVYRRCEEIACRIRR